MNYTEFAGKKIALLIWNLEKENDAHVYTGEIRKTGEGFKFVDDSRNWNLTLDEKLLSRLRIVSDDAKEIFMNSDYYLFCSLTGLPENPDQDMVFTGMKWH